MSRGRFAARGSVGSYRGSAGFAAPRSGVHFGTTFGTGFRGPFVSANRFYHRRFYYGYPGWSYGYYGAGYAYPGYYMYPGYYADYDYPSADTTYPGYNASASYFDPNSQYQQNEIDRLENEVSQLREERAARAHPGGNSEPQPATVLVFQDKHSEEVQNYVVVGETLWIFTEDHARKVSLSDLDIPATQKANGARGVDFGLPEQN